MMGWKDLFKPRQDKFLRLLTEQAAKTLEGMEALEEYMKNANEEAAKRVTRIEKEADEVRRILIDELLRTFITPIDPEDIFALSRAIDDIIDYGYTTVDEMEILNVEPNPHLQHMVSKLRKAAEEIHLGVLRLDDHPNVANEHAVRAKAMENQVEQIYREAIADLFSGPTDLEQVIKMLKLREIYRHLSNCADRGDEAANIIGDIIGQRT
jgi:predicted phosphate transport protein (TIGR00153 family)